MEVKKAIIPIAGLATRFLPLSRAVPKEFFPLAEKPIIQYIIEEMRGSGIEEIIFVVAPGQKAVINYFKKSPELEKILEQRKKEQTLKELKEFEETFKDISFSSVQQKIPLGDGHAILQAVKNLKSEAVAVSFGDDVIDSEIPAIRQLVEIFSTCSAPVVGLKFVPKDKVQAYGAVQAEKIASRLYKIKKIVEKPEPGKEPSNLVIAGKHILTPEVYGYLKKARPSKRGEIILAEVFSRMLDDGKPIYGYEMNGEWLECGDKAKWMKSFFYMALKNPKYSEKPKNILELEGILQTKAIKNKSIKEVMRLEKESVKSLRIRNSG